MSSAGCSTTSATATAGRPSRPRSTPPTWSCVVSPIWNGQPSSLFLQVGERLNAVLADSDEHRRTPLYGKVGVIGVVGNEDGAHHVGAVGMGMLADLGLTFGPACVAYYLGEDLVEQDEVPQQQRDMAALTCGNAAHLAGLLRAGGYPGVPAT